MKKKLLAYTLSGRTYTSETDFFDWQKVLGIDTEIWSEKDLNNNVPFMTISYEQDIPQNYTDISSIKNWDKLNDDVLENFKQIRILFLENDNWEFYTEDEKKIIAKYFLVDKNKRDEALSEEEQEESNYYKLYNCVSKDVLQKGVDIFEPPHSINYKIDLENKIYPDYTFNDKGLLVECTYYKFLEQEQNQMGLTINSFSEPILKYEAEYTFRDNGYVGERTVKRMWYKMDGTLDEDNPKISNKKYPPMIARDEGRRRRRNLINNLILEAVYLIIITSPDLNNVIEAEEDAISFLDEISDGINRFYEYGNRFINGQPFLLFQQIQNSDYIRLDNFVPNTNDTLTIRDYLLNKVNN